ncbi:MAG: transporter substrate-binding domain-containing protein, partial [Clostridia bacterium]|nr:transporter substrate-binding domain-containing protein [Clostridia bacterium]
MSRYKKIPAVMLLIALVFLFVGAGRPINVELYLTQGERDYIAGRGVIRAASIAGGAPLHYRDSKGEIRGIAVNVLKEIADMTGLAVEYELYDNVSLAFNSGADIFFGVTTQYAPEGMILSKPYLKSDTVLFMNSSLDYKRLSDKRYAALANGSIPVGVEEENTIYFNNREESMDAVEAGKADYGYGNA